MAKLERFKFSLTPEDVSALEGAVAGAVRRGDNDVTTLKLDIKEGDRQVGTIALDIYVNL